MNFYGTLPSLVGFRSAQERHSFFVGAVIGGRLQTSVRNSHFFKSWPDMGERNGLLAGRVSIGKQGFKSSVRIRE